MIDAPEIKQNTNGIWMLEGEQLWDSDILPVCLGHIKEGDTVIDAGAWIGGHAMAYAKKVGENGKVIAFEPNPDAYECLKRNVSPLSNGGNLEIYPEALGDVRNQVSFSVKKGWGDSGHVGYEEGAIIVWMNRLDNYNFAPNFIKIDVEGCELKVLKGAAKTIEKRRPVMVVEINAPALKRQGSDPQQVIDWLTRNNYGMNMIEECTGQDIHNLLCMPK